MNYELNIDEIDRDGALRETAEEAMQDTRLGFLKKAGIGAAGLASSGAILGALSVPEAFAAGKGSHDRPPAFFGKGDFGILNYAFTLELLEQAFYNEATKNNVAASDPKTNTFLQVVTADENAHVKALRAALGNKNIFRKGAPKFNFGNATRDLATFQQTAYALEKTGTGAYPGQAPNIKSAKILLTALSIVTIEARHTGAIASITGNAIAPNPFDLPVGYRGTKKAVEGTGFLVSPKKLP